MKKQLMMALTMLSLIVTLAVTSARAQSGVHSMRIVIPFDFIIKGETLPSGEYIIKRSVSARPEMLLISSVKGGSGVYVLTSNVLDRTRQSESKLVFHQYEDKYFLTQVWTDGDNAGRELPKSSRERAIDSKLAKNRMDRKTLTLIARRR